jgi:hypothetical protein
MVLVTEKPAGGAKWFTVRALTMAKSICFKNIE